MNAGPIPPQVADAGRLAVLANYDILDTPAEPGFDDIVHLACQLCDVPVSLVSLVAEDRQWFKARVGFPHCQTDLSSSVCVHALAHPDQVLIIPDLTQDERTSANPLVTGEPFIRFYAGAPLVTPDGDVLGTLCVIDNKPRAEGLSIAQAVNLRALARQVSMQLELRRAIAMRDAAYATEAAYRSEADKRRAALLQVGDQLRDVATVPEMTRTASEIVGHTLGTTRAGFGRIIGNVDFIEIEPDWTAPGMTSITGRHRFEDYGDIRQELLRGHPLVIEDVTTDPRTRDDPGPMQAIRVAALVNMPVRERGRTVAVFIVHDDKPRIWSAEALAFLRNVADRVEVGVARLQAEERQAVLNRELSHRLKNTLAIVQSIAAQTLRGVSERDMVEAFERRVLALSRAHDVLMQKSWSAARMRAVMESVLALQTDLDRFAFDGPDMDITPEAALSLSLLLHELATNALKYGALSAPEGKIVVAWRAESEQRPTLVLGWTEEGGPHLSAPPSRKGFGSKLIRMGLLGTRSADLRYEANGLKAEFRAPLAELQPR